MVTAPSYPKTSMKAGKEIWWPRWSFPVTCSYRPFCDNGAFLPPGCITENTTYLLRTLYNSSIFITYEAEIFTTLSAMFTVRQQHKQKEMWCQTALQLKIQVPLFRQVPQQSLNTAARNGPALLLSIKQKLRVFFVCLFFSSRNLVTPVTTQLISHSLSLIPT